MQLEPHGVVAVDHRLGHPVDVSRLDTRPGVGQTRAVGGEALECSGEVGADRLGGVVDDTEALDDRRVVLGIGVVVEDLLALRADTQLPVGAETEQLLIETEEAAVRGLDRRLGAGCVEFGGGALGVGGAACGRERPSRQASVAAQYEPVGEVQAEQRGRVVGGHPRRGGDDARLADAFDAQHAQHRELGVGGVGHPLHVTGEAWNARPMRAAVLRTIPGRLEITDVDIASPGPGEVLVKTAAVGLCHSDLHFMTGDYPHPTPTVLGHEAAGVVAEVGPGVDYVQPGDHVIGCLSVFCGRCTLCLSGRPSLCLKEGLDRPAGALPRLTLDFEACHQFFSLSSFAEYMLVHENALVKIRKDMPLDRAALIGCGVTTGLGAVFRTAAVEATATVAVIGCGGIGLNCIQGAALAGASKVIAVDMNPTKLQLARDFGATDTVNASEVDPVAAVLQMTGGGVEHAFEAIGLKTTAEQAFAMLGPGGTATLIGLIPVGQSVELPGYAFLAERKVQGSNMGSNRFRFDMPRYVDMYLDGRLKLDELVSARIGLDDINEGFAAMTKGEVARSVIVF